MSAVPSLRSYRVGVRLPDWAQGFANRIFSGLLDWTRAGHPMELEIEQPSGHDLERVRIGADWQGDGLLVFRHSAEEARAWSERGISVVNLSAEAAAKGPAVPQVTLDNEACGEMAAEHFLSLGLRKFAFWHDPLRVYSAERLAGYRRRLARAGHEVALVEVASSSFPRDLRARQNLEIGWRALARLEAPCGLFAKDDIAAVCAVRALRRVGLRVPQDVAVLGVGDDLVYCQGMSPALSSVRYPARQIGLTAAGLLHRMMEGGPPPPPRSRIPPRGVVVRESTGHVELADEALTRALRVIRAKAPHGRLTSMEVCRLAGVSRESLRLRFRELLGRTPKEEIDEVRATRVADLLRHTPWTVERVAVECGFGSSDELCRFFKRVKGMSPGQWRRG